MVLLGVVCLISEACKGEVEAAAEIIGGFLIDPLLENAENRQARMRLLCFGLRVNKHVAQQLSCAL